MQVYLMEARKKSQLRYSKPKNFVLRKNNPGVSQKNYNLQFVDWVAHCIWIRYEDNELQPFEILSPFIKVRQLYF